MSTQRITEKPLFENCRIIYRNFSGVQTDYNRAGDRNFCVIIDDRETADRMLADGWNIKIKPPLDEGGDDLVYLPVSVSYKNRPPKIVMLSSVGSTPLKESNVGMLDYADIKMVDLVVNPYNWGPINGKSGVKAYVKSMFVTIDEDPLEMKYASQADISEPEGIDDEPPF